VSTGTRRRVTIGLIACLAAGLAGCASVSDHAQNSSLSALKPVTPKQVKAPTRTEAASCLAHPFRSLPPTAALPQPGRMPAGTFLHAIQHRGQLIVGVDQSSLGLGYFNPTTRRMEGFDIDLVRAVARAIFASSAHHIRYEAISTAQRDSVIPNGDVDIVASAYSITCERRSVMLFSSTYHVSHQKLLVPKNSNVSSLGDRDLRYKSVCGTKTSTSFKRLLRSQARTHVAPVGVDLRTDCLALLQEGVVAAITSDEAILLGFQRQDPQTKIVGPSLETERYGMAINIRHPELVRFVNAVLLRLRRNGCAKAIERHWLTRKTVPTRDSAYVRCTRRRA
jgi:polar amino acid transport system substrate-binding protein